MLDTGPAIHYLMVIVLTTVHPARGKRLIELSAIIQEPS